MVERRESARNNRRSSSRSGAGGRRPSLSIAFLAFSRQRGSNELPPTTSAGSDAKTLTVTPCLRTLGRITHPTMEAKTKVSVTVQSELLREVDRAAGGRSRSAVFEEAVASWVRCQRKVDLDRAIEVYYRSLDKDERVEDAEWARLADESIKAGWN